MSESPEMNLRELVAIQQERWSSGDCVLVEDLISECGQPTGTADDLMDLVYAEVVLREEAGDAPQEQEYCQRFPELRDAIGRQFQVHRAVSAASFGSTDINAGETALLPNRSASTGLPTLPGFEIVGTIGRGASGVVFEAIEESLDRPVAIKVLAGASAFDDKQRKQLLKEASAIASLKHPGIVDVYQVSEFDGSPFIVMELVRGGSLAEELSRGPLEPSTATDQTIAIAEAVQHAHEHGIVHRDIKPGNVLLDTDGRPRICDFGLARTLKSDHSLHATGDIVGTPAYMAPEQARGERAGERADVYSIGAVLYEMLCGRPPYEAATSWEILNQIMTTDAVALRQLNPGVPQDLETICAKCLEKDVARRYATAGEVAEELSRFRAGQPIIARPVGHLQRLWKWARRNRRVAALTATIVVLLLSLGFGSLVVAIQLASSNQAIRDEQKAAAEAQDAAEQDRTAAMAALNQLVDSLYEDLSRNSASVKTQQKILDAAITGLQSITSVAGDRAPEESQVKAFQRIGELLSLQGRNPEAVEYYQRAIDITRRQLSSDAEDIDNKRSLSISVGMLAAHYMSVGNASDAEPLAEESNRLAREVLAQIPDDVGSLRQIVTNHQRTMDSKWSSFDDKSVIKYGGKALADADRLIRLAPRDTVALGIAQGFHFRVGRSHLNDGDVTAAEGHFDLARTYVDQALAIEPGRTKLLTASATITRAHALTAQNRGELKAAVELFDMAMHEFQSLADADPANQSLQRQVANTNSLFAGTCYSLGRYKDAIESAHRGEKTYARLIEESPDNSDNRVLIAEVKFNEANAHLGLNNWSAAAECYRRVRHYLTAAEFGEPVTKGTAGAYLAVSDFIHEGCAIITATLKGEPSPTGQCVALMLAARAAAFETTGEELPPTLSNRLDTISGDQEITTFASLFKHMYALEGVHPYIGSQRRVWEGRAYAVQARLIAKSDSSSRLTEAKNQQVTGVLELLLKESGGLQFVYLEPDFAWFVTQPAFHELLNSQSTPAQEPHSP